nr:transposase [Xenorhabdus sp. 5]
MYGNKGYLPQALCDELKEESLTLITNIRRNLKGSFYHFGIR